MCETNRFPAKCQICAEPIAAGEAAGGLKAGTWCWICKACSAAAGGPPLKVLEAFLLSFSDEAGGPEDERDHEDFYICDALAERLKSLGKPFLGHRVGEN